MIRTTDLALAAADRDWIPVRRSWRLNGRHYGALQGRYKADVLRQHGEEQFRQLTWQCEQTIRNHDPCISCATHFLDLAVDRV
jgi:bisphosphoglycerate-dependent phosphoglycerate mutase